MPKNKTLESTVPVEAGTFLDSLFMSTRRKRHHANIFRCDVFCRVNGAAPRHIDPRPFVPSGKTVSMVPAGLTRAALQENPLVVNSSPDGTKNTWIHDDPPETRAPSLCYPRPRL